VRYVRLTNPDAEAIIDDQDWELVAPFRWRFDGEYVLTWVPHPEGGWVPRSDGSRRRRRYSLKLSRLIMGLQYGDQRQVDHDNHNTLDNRRSNLVVVTNAENGQNLLSKPGSSRYRGVGWHTKRSRWQAYVMLDGKQHHLGYFTLEEEAARVAAEWRAEHMPHSAEARTSSTY
jgi:hypothetical protein